MSDEILYEKQDRVVVVTINRPERRNAINHAVREGLHDAWRRFERDEDARVAILTGAGERAFCAGMDLVQMSQEKLGSLPRDFLPILGDNVSVTKPVIAAVNGAAYAGGWLFAQMCDLCVASENATFAITEVKVGRGMVWAPPLIHMIPQRVMLELLLTGRSISAQRAYEIGFVNQVVPPGQLMSAAMQLAREIVDGAPLTAAAAKEMVYLSTEMGRTAALRAAYHVFEPVLASEDAQEGPAAFREKRKPVWRGR
ncbi:MAG: enoyl-CoA hydratase-related protein [Burkholderiaceae bacterium]|nr:enoyl-CoA hydratase-related protein [Burkholderiaceae bacterium]